VEVAKANSDTITSWPAAICILVNILRMAEDSALLFPKGLMASDRFIWVILTNARAFNSAIDEYMKAHPMTIASAHFGASVRNLLVRRI
jgi:hypothetical protein